jgi:phospholipase C
MRGNTLLARTISALAIISICVGPAMAGPKSKSDGSGGTATPIQHVVVIFQENVSFDHYFGSYPNATGFVAQPGTPTVNGLTGSLLTNNPNKNNPGNAPNQINPFLLDRSQASTCDQDHAYGDEQKAFDMGLMDMFPASVGQGGISDEGFCNPMYAYGMDKGIVEAYFDGNTVTAMWNYAQNYALNQNFYGTTFGPSTPGVLNLVAGDTSPATPSASSTKVVPNNSGPGTLVGDADPTGDACSSKTAATVQMGGQNIGNLHSGGAELGFVHGRF